MIDPITTKVAAGLRKMNKEPAAFLFISKDLDWTWDLETVCGIPVFHGVALNCYFWGLENEECHFIPLGNTEGEITLRDRRRFADGYLGVG